VTVLDWTIVALYVALMLGIGYWVYRTMIKSFDDYYLAGRNLSLTVLIGTITSTYFGLDSVLGDSELGFTLGASGLFAYPVVGTALIIVLAFLGPSIQRRSGEKRPPAESIGSVYGHPARLAAAVGSAVYSFPLLGFMAMGFIARVALGLPYWMGVVFGAVIVVIYTDLGGMRADAITDAFQFGIIGVGVGAGALIMWSRMGNQQILEGLREFVGGDPAHFLAPSGGWLTAGLFFTYAISAVSVFCEPGLFQRIFAARSPGTVRSAFVIGALAYLLFGVCATFIGVLSAAAVGKGILPADIHANEVLIAASVRYLPVGLLGLFIAGILAAGMSTIDSQLVIAGANVSYDAYKSVIRPQASDAQVILVSRVGIVIIAAVSVALSFFFKRIMGAGVFISGTLTKALYGQGRVSRLAGNAAALFGLAATIAYYLVLTLAGSLDPDWGTYILRFSLFGRPVALWQEYNVFIILPVMVGLYWIIHALDPNKRVRAQEA